MPGRIPMSTVLNAVRKVNAGGRSSVPVSGDVMDMMQMMELPEKKLIFPKGKSWLQHYKPQPLNEPHMPFSKASYTQGFNSIVKSAWIFSGPLGTADVMHAPEIPKNLWDTVHGGSDKDEERKSPWRSLGKAGLGIGSVLFGLGFAGMGARDLGLKLSILAKRALKNKVLNKAETAMAHKMDIPAYRRFGQGMAGAVADKGYGLNYLKQPMKGLGYAAGGIAHPFNKLEDYLTKVLMKGMGPSSAARTGASLGALSEHAIFDNPGVRAASSLTALPLLIAGDAILADPPKEAAWLAGFNAKCVEYGIDPNQVMIKMAREELEQGIGEDVKETFGPVAGIGAELSKFLPVVGSVPAAYDFGRDMQNMWNDPGVLNKGKHLMYGAGNLGLAGASLFGGNTILKAPKFLAGLPKMYKAYNEAMRPLNALRATKPAQTITNSKPMQYWRGETQWQKNLFGNRLPAAAAGPTTPGLAPSPFTRGAKWYNPATYFAGQTAGQVAPAMAKSVGAHMAGGPQTQYMVGGMLGGGMLGGNTAMDGGAGEQAGNYELASAPAATRENYSPYQEGFNSVVRR